MKMRKRMVMSLLIALTLVITSVPEVLAATSPAYMQSIGGNFDSGLPAAFEVMTTTRKLALRANADAPGTYYWHNGTQALCGGVASWEYAPVKITVEPDTIYYVSMDVTSNQGGSFYVYYCSSWDTSTNKPVAGSADMFMSGNYNNTDKHLISGAAAQTVYSVNAYIKTKAEQTSMYLAVRDGAGKNQNFCVDNLNMYALPSEGEDAIINGDFEDTSVTQWSAKGGATAALVTGTDAIDSHSVKISNAGQNTGYQQRIFLEEGAAYEISADVKLINGSGSSMTPAIRVTPGYDGTASTTRGTVGDYAYKVSEGHTTTVRTIYYIDGNTAANYVYNNECTVSVENAASNTCTFSVDNIRCKRVKERPVLDVPVIKIGGNVVDNIWAGATVQAVVPQITNPTATAKPYYVILAVYKGDRLFRVEFSDPQTVWAKGNANYTRGVGLTAATATVSYTLPASLDDGDYVVRAFCWDSIDDTITPLTEFAERTE